jgi:hypothetical protein
MSVDSEMRRFYRLDDRASCHRRAILGLAELLLHEPPFDETLASAWASRK